MELRGRGTFPLPRPPGTPVLRKSAEKGSLPKTPTPLNATGHPAQESPTPALCFGYRGPVLPNGGYLRDCQSPPDPSRPGALLPRYRPGRSPAPNPAGTRGCPWAAGAAPAAGSPAQAASASGTRRGGRPAAAPQPHAAPRTTAPRRLPGPAAAQWLPTPAHLSAGPGPAQGGPATGSAQPRRPRRGSSQGSASSARRRAAGRRSPRTGAGCTAPHARLLLGLVV